MPTNAKPKSNCLSENFMNLSGITCVITDPTVDDTNLKSERCEVKPSVEYCRDQRESLDGFACMILLFGACMSVFLWALPKQSAILKNPILVWAIHAFEKSH